VKDLFFESDGLDVRIIDVLKFKLNGMGGVRKKRNFCALSYRLDSKSAIIITPGGKYELRSGSVAFFQAGIKYQRTSKDDELIAVHFILDGVSFSTAEIAFPKCTERLRELFVELYEVWQKREAGVKNRTSALFYAILAELNAEFGRELPEEKSNFMRIKPGVDYIHDSFFDSSVSCDEAAAKSFVSPSYFRRVFKAHFGISPRIYIIRLRIEHAQRLIDAGYHSVSEVAELCGFADSKYFATEFKKITGVSPSSYNRTKRNL
jgi:AraC-like DNA-binding protein